MVEEYKSIMNNDVWEIVTKPEGKSIVTSIFLYKIKHAVDGSTEKHKSRFPARISHIKKEYTTMGHSLLWPGTQLFKL